MIVELVVIFFCCLVGNILNCQKDYGAKLNYLWAWHSSAQFFFVFSIQTLKFSFNLSSSEWSDLSALVILYHISPSLVNLSTVATVSFVAKLSYNFNLN